MVYSLPSAQIKKIVLVRVRGEHHGDLVQFQSMVARKYMPFGYDVNAVKEIPSLGRDNTKAYGYAQDHHTLELHLQLWLAHSEDVLLHGTPPPCRRLIDLVFSFWNKCMGNVDIVRKVLRGKRAVRGPDSGHGSLLWMILIRYTLYHAFCLYQHGQLEINLNKFESFKQFQAARQKITFTKFLYKLAKGGCFDEKLMEAYFPGLKELINCCQRCHPLLMQQARAVTNIVECRQNTWAYENDRLMSRVPQEAHPPPPLPDSASVREQVAHSWKVCLSSVIVLTLLQRTADWFLARYFRFTSTDLHVVVNVNAAVYLNTTPLRELHNRIIGILRLKLRKTITIQNPAESEDEDLPDQRLRKVLTELDGERRSVIGDEKCS